MPDMSLVLDEDIWKELCKRYDGAIMVTLRRVDDGHDDTVINYHGGRALCVGLCEHVKDKLLSVMRGDVEHTEES
jgi:hypothetical protein